MGGIFLVNIISIVIISSSIFDVSGFDIKWTEQRKEAFLVAGCIARCEKNLSCRKQCHERSNRKIDGLLFGDKGPTISGPANFNATLHCKDTDVIKIIHNSGIWVIEESSLHDDSWNKTGRIQVSEKMSSAFKNLSAATSYRYRAYRIMDDGFISEPQVSPWFSTFEMDHQPEQLDNVEVANQTLDDINPSRVRADIVIRPASDRSCRYDVISWNENEGLTIAEFESSQDFRFSLDNVDYGTNVTVFVSARNTGSSKNSNNASLTFVTPSCFQLQRNPRFCAPGQVKGLRISGISENASDYEIVVTWDEPEFIPASYVLQSQYLDNLNEGPNLITLPGNSTEAVVNIKKRQVDHRHQGTISIIAESLGGISIQTWINVNIDETLNIFSAKGTASTVGNNFFTDGIMAVSSVAVFTIAGGIFYAYHLRRNKRRISCDKNRYKYCQNLKESEKSVEQSFYGLNKAKSMEFDNKYPLLPTDEFEICPIQLTIEDVLLGSGAYGTVRLGRFYSPKKQAINVAVKALRDDANTEDLKNFRQEISLMKSAGHHPNIVSIIGCCTLDIRNPLLIVEYCSHGDLQTYLRRLWQEIMSQALERRARCKIVFEDNAVKATSADKVENAMNVKSWIVAHQVAIANTLYDIQGDPKYDEEVTIVADLLKFARQVAYGMEFLSSNRIIHRDLAARNILVCADKTVKISDFGLSRDIYQENVYKKQGNGRLPLKWMAIEALTHQIYTTKSDVWSFGILLWEIVTLGSNPYPETPTNMVLQLLKSGYRMKRPDNCGNELYDIMRSCWHSRPRFRPNFTQLKNQLDRLVIVNENLNILWAPINSRNSLKLVNNHYSNIYSK